MPQARLVLPARTRPLISISGVMALERARSNCLLMSHRLSPCTLAGTQDIPVRARETPQRRNGGMATGEGAKGANATSPLAALPGPVTLWDVVGIAKTQTHPATEGFSFTVRTQTCWPIAARFLLTRPPCGGHNSGGQRVPSF